MDRAAHLADHRRVWERKGVLRLVYDDFYDRVAAACRPGLTLEIGGGIGNLKRRLADVVSLNEALAYLRGLASGQDVAAAARSDFDRWWQGGQQPAA